MSREQTGKQNLAGLNADEKRIVREVDEQEVIDYCRKLVAIPSIFGSEHRISDQIAHDLKDFGLEVTSVPVANCGPCVVGASSKPKSLHQDLRTLIFNGHMDTVPVCDGWTRDPFSPSVEGDRLYGLGSVDMKGGLAAMIMAAKLLISLRVRMKRDFAVHAVCDEEAWGRGTTTLIDQGFYATAECCIVGEPSNLDRLRNARRGTRYMDVTVTGKSTHASQPEHGINAIVEAAKVIEILSRLPDKTHPRILDFKLQPLKTSSCVLKVDGGSEALSVPEKCVIRLDRHVLPGTSLLQELENVKAYLEHNLDKDTFGRVRVEFTPQPGGALGYEAFETDPKSELVKTIQDVSSIFGYNPPLVAGFSVADDCTIAARCKVPVVSYGPDGDISTHASGGAHEADEFVLTQQVVDSVKIYAVTAYRIINRS
jgi:succinyl-diaminopimelate desuccinylase